MRTITIGILAVLVLGLGAALILTQSQISTLKAAVASETEKNSPEWLFTHQREIWLANLEWCESRGIPSAVNPKDRDGTPSFGAFQFKPDTFRGYSKKYALSGSLMDYASQKAILVRMLDDKDVKWSQEFPDCTSKLGQPPTKF